MRGLSTELKKWNTSSRVRVLLSPITPNDRRRIREGTRARAPYSASGRGHGAACWSRGIGGRTGARGPCKSLRTTRTAGQRTANRPMRKLHSTTPLATADTHDAFASSVHLEGFAYAPRRHLRRRPTRHRELFRIYHCPRLLLRPRSLLPVIPRWFLHR